MLNIKQKELLFGTPSSLLINLVQPLNALSENLFFVFQFRQLQLNVAQQLVFLLHNLGQLKSQSLILFL
jgi:hypothetical protein